MIYIPNRILTANAVFQSASVFTFCSVTAGHW